MAKSFYERLNSYYGAVGKVLLGQAETASIFPNTSDIGICREWIYARFLKAHLPTNCNVILGGFLFNTAGEESYQMDVLIITNKCPQYNMLNDEGLGKSFSAVEGTAAVASLKSKIDKKSIFDALKNIGSVPDFVYGAAKRNDSLFKIVYAPTGISAKLALQYINEYYQKNPTDSGRMIDLLHVPGKYFISRLDVGKSHKVQKNYTITPDLKFHGLAVAISHIQHAVYVSTTAGYNFSLILKKLVEK